MCVCLSFEGLLKVIHWDWLVGGFPAAHESSHSAQGPPTENGKFLAPKMGEEADLGPKKDGLRRKNPKMQQISLVVGRFLGSVSAWVSKSGEMWVLSVLPGKILLNRSQLPTPPWCVSGVLVFPPFPRWESLGDTKLLTFVPKTSPKRFELSRSCHFWCKLGGPMQSFTASLLLGNMIPKITLGRRSPPVDTRKSTIPWKP